MSLVAYGLEESRSAVHGWIRPSGFTEQALSNDLPFYLGATLDNGILDDVRLLPNATQADYEFDLSINYNNVVPTWSSLDENASSASSAA